MSSVIKIETWIWLIIALPTVYVSTVFYSSSSTLGNITLFLWAAILTYYAFMAPQAPRSTIVKVISFCCFPLAFSSIYGLTFELTAPIDQAIINLSLSKPITKALLLYCVPFLNALFACVIFVPAIVKISGNLWPIYSLVGSTAFLLTMGEYILSLISLFVCLICSFAYLTIVQKTNPNNTLKSQASPAGAPLGGVP